MLASCATTELAWDKPGSTQQAYYQESGQCRAQAFSVPGVSQLQAVLVFENCMQGKGWYQVEVPKQR